MKYLREVICLYDQHGVVYTLPQPLCFVHDGGYAVKLPLGTSIINGNKPIRRIKTFFYEISLKKDPTEF